MKNSSWANDPATEKQIACVKRFVAGMKEEVDTRGMTKGEASFHITRLRNQAKEVLMMRGSENEDNGFTMYDIAQTC